MVDRAGPCANVHVMVRVHGTCVALDGRGVLLRGPSGAGKSDLALRLIGAGAELVADDQVEIERRGDVLIARPPAILAGLIEVRGVGILRLGARTEAALALVIDLVGAKEIERLPEPERTTIAEIGLPRVALDAHEPSASIKVRLALGVASGNIMSL